MSNKESSRSSRSSRSLQANEDLLTCEDSRTHGVSTSRVVFHHTADCALLLCKSDRFQLWAGNSTPEVRVLSTSRTYKGRKPISTAWTVELLDPEVIFKQLFRDRDTKLFIPAYSWEEALVYLKVKLPQVRLTPFTLKLSLQNSFPADFFRILDAEAS